MKSIDNFLKSSFCLMIALLVAVGCSEEYEYTTDYSFYDGVTLKMNLVDENNMLSVRLANKTHMLTIAVTPEDVFIDSKAYIYEVADNSIATVGQDGTITLKKAGKTTLTAKFRGNQEIATSCTLNVLPTFVSELKVNVADIRVEEGKELDLAPLVTVIPSDADNKDLVYTVKEGSEEFVETTEGSSILKALSKGTATVIVSAADGSGLSIEMTVEVTGRIPVERIDLNNAANLNGKTAPIGQAFNLGALVTVYPANASEQTLAYELVSGNAEVDEQGVVKTLGAGDVEIKISATDEFQQAASQTIKFTVDASQTLLERSLWFVDTSIVYANGKNYTTDNATGNPEHLIDGKDNTYLALTKPGKKYNEEVTPANHVLYFTVDMKSEQEFNYFTYKHRNNNQNFQVFKISVYGSNDGEDYTAIQKDIVIGPKVNSEPLEIEQTVELSTYRYIKVEYLDWNKNAGTNVCVAEFNIGKK